MMSNIDPEGDKKAFQQILACTLANTATPFAMSYLGLVHPVFLVPFMIAQAKALQAVF